MAAHPPNPADCDDPDEPAAEWFARTFAERRRAIEAAFGPSRPPGQSEGSVISFDWTDVTIPGGCCLVCPSQPDGDAWAYIGLGLTQPPDRTHAAALRKRTGSETGYGAEFALLVSEPGEWAFRVVRQLMWYVRGRRPINAGDRMPFGAERDPEAGLDANVGDQAAEGRPLEGAMRALIFWPYLRGPSSFRTSAGPFDVLAGTTITAAEWNFAREHSSEHLLLLLYRCGVGQVSDLARPDLVTGHRWGEDVRLVASMSRSRAAEELRAFEVNRRKRKRHD